MSGSITSRRDTSQNRENESCSLLLDTRDTIRRLALLRWILKDPKRLLLFFFHQHFFPLSFYIHTRSFFFFHFDYYTFFIHFYFSFSSSFFFLYFFYYCTKHSQAEIFLCNFGIDSTLLFTLIHFIFNVYRELTYIHTYIHIYMYENKK